MNDKWRIGLTLMFWVVGIGITLLFLSYVSAGILSDWLVIVPLVITLMATVTFWGVDSEKTRPEKSDVEKRSDSTAYSMALLMEMMDEDERQSFKERLQERILSGDAVTDESLIADMERRKRG